MTVGEVVELIDRYAADGAPRSRPTRRSASCARPRRGLSRSRPTRGSWSADAVVVASGACNAPALPAVAAEPAGRDHLPHGVGVPEPGQVPEGGVLVVGASASGIQIADELLRDGRDVTIAVGEHVRVPRRYRGRGHPLVDGGGRRPRRALDRDGRPRPGPQHARRCSSPAGGATLDLNALTARGARLVGRLAGDPRPAAAVLRLAAQRLPAGRPEARPAARHARRLGGRRGHRGAAPGALRADGGAGRTRRSSCDLERGEIRSVLWATGYRPELSWLEAADAQPARPPDPRRRRDARPRALPDGDAVPAPAQVDAHRRRGRRRPRR